MQEGVASEPVVSADVESAALSPPDDRLSSAAPGQRPMSNWASRAFLWANAAALAAVLIGGMFIVHNGYVAVPDEGVYSAQALNLADGSWAGSRPAPDIDVDGKFDALGPLAVVGDQVIPHGRNPIYPVVLAPAYKLGGTVGLLLVSVLGTWVAAVVTAFIARRFRLGYGVPALWLTGLGTPLVFSAVLVAAHSLAAAACAVMLLALAMTLDQRRVLFLPVAVFATGLLVGLRSEGLIVAIAVGLVVGLMSMPTPRARTVDRLGVATALSVLGAAAVSFQVNNWWASRIVAGSGVASALGTLPVERDPLAAAWIALLRPWESGLNAEAAALLTFAAVVLSGVILRLVPRMRALSLGLLLVAALSAILLITRPPGLLTGLLPAFPVLVALVFLRRDDFRKPAVVRLLGVVAVSTIGLLATVYSDGGAAQWGGRFFHVLIPAMVPLVLIGLDRARSRLETGEALFAAACLIVVALSLSVVAVRTNADYRNRFRNLVVSTKEVVASASPGERQIVLYAPIAGDGVGRGFWNERDSLEVLTAPDPRLIFPIVGSAAEAGADRVVVLTVMNGATLRVFDRGVLERIGWDTTDEVAIGNGWYVVTIERNDGED